MHAAIRLALAGAITVTMLTTLTATSALADAVTDVKINEVESNGDTADWVELVNNGTAAADVSGWLVKDNDDGHVVAIDAGTIIPVGGFLAVETDTPATGYGLGGADSARVFTADGATLVDSYTWTAHSAITYGRCPDGTGAFITTALSTKGAANNCVSPVHITEVESNGDTFDWIEIHNPSPVAADVSGFVVMDSGPQTLAFPASTVVAPGAYATINTNDVAVTGNFGLGGADAARIFAADGTTLVSEYSWTAHATTTYGRCPNPSGEFTTTAAGTKGAVNDCGATIPTGLKINEVESNGDTTDWVELSNTDAAAADVSGYVLKDNSATDPGVTLAPGSVVPAGGHLVIEPSFGLGGADQARLFAADGSTLVDSYEWAVHAATTYGRCPDGSGAFIETVSSTKGATNACPSPFDPLDVKLNEIESNGDQVADWVELTNTGATPADISGWKLKDAGASNPFVTIPANTVIQPGGFFATYTEFPPPGFGLGVDDTITLYQADGSSKVDEHSWTGGHAGTTLGRCADGIGAWQETTVSTRGTANACSPIRLNEIVSDPVDSVELVNLSGAPIDVAGWVIKDGGDANPTTLPSPSIVPANGHLLVTTLAAGLGGADSVRLFDPTATLIDSYSWTVHGVPSYGRCKDGVGAFALTATVTPGAVNECPGLETEPWPGSQTVQVSDDATTFVQDASGVVFDPADANTLWVSQNKAGTLWKLTRTGSTWAPATGWTGGKNPRYADGTGAPDSEGITVGPDGAIYLATERDNAVSGVSRNAVLRYEPGTSMDATDEWSLNALLPTLGANLGLEGISWIPDSYLTGGGFVDQSTSAAYDPAHYANHGGGLYVVAVEGTGMLYVLALEQTAAVQETAHLVATLDPELKTNAGPAAAMDVSWDPENERLWAVCDDSCDGVTVTMELDAGSFVVAGAYDRPVGMPNLNNEGLAFAPQSACVAGTKEVVWTDDGDTDGHSLRSGTIGCEVLVTPSPSPTPTPTTTATPTPTPTTAPTTTPTTAPTTATPSASPTTGAVTITKAGKGRLEATAQTVGKLVLNVTSTGGVPTGKFLVRLGGFDGVFKATLRANGKLVIRVPELAKAGTRSLKVTFLGDDLHPRTTRKFVLRVVVV